MKKKTFNTNLKQNKKIQNLKRGRPKINYKSNNSSTDRKKKKKVLDCILNELPKNTQVFLKETITETMKGKEFFPEFDDNNQFFKIGFKKIKKKKIKKKKN
jgi:hypothetical protein